LERAIDTKKGTDKEKARAESRTAEKLKIELDALPMATWQKVARFTSIRPRLWSQLYSTLLIPDADSFQLVLNVIGRISGFAELWQKAYIRGTGDLHKNLERTRRAINVALSTVQSGFGNLCTRFCNSSVPVVLEQFMEQHHTVEDLILCIFSPVQDFQDGSMQILGQVFQDAALRSECLRAIMKAYPERSRRALVHLLTGFNRRVEELPDACESAKTLVRALTDVMVALCSQDVSQERGLLYDDELRSRLTGRGADSDIGTMWKLMTQAISSIFAKAPVWSAYYDDSALKLWLRDALIFARELANERRLFQAAVSQKEGAAKSNTSIILLSPSKMKRRARDMVKDLLIVFSGALRWLRITDLELLHQSFSLIESLFEIFKESGIVISEDYIKQLNGVIDHAKRSPTLEPQRQSRLNNSQVQRLVAMVEESKDDGDEIIEIQASDFKRPEKAPVAIAKKPEILPVPKKEPAKTQGGSIAPKPIIGLQPFSGAKPGLPKTPAGRFAGPKAGSRASSSVAEDSDSDSSDSSDDSDKGVSVLATKQKSPEKVVQRHRGIQLLPGFGTQVGTAQNRIDRQSDAQRTLKRLKPDLTGLHKMILGWNYDANGDLPPGFDGSTLKEVPKQFGSVEQYTAVLGPLLMLEIWSQLMKSKDDDQELVNCIIGPKAFVDSWTELELQIPQTFDSKWFVTDTDICVLRNPTTKTKILCKVENSKKTALRYVVNIRFLGKGSPNNGEQWLFSKVFRLAWVPLSEHLLIGLLVFQRSIASMVRCRVCSISTCVGILSQERFRKPAPLDHKRSSVPWRPIASTSHRLWRFLERLERVVSSSSKGK
jgi:senataxin